MTETATNQNETDRSRVENAIRHCDELTRLIREETRLMKENRHDELANTTARTAEIEPILSEIAETGIRIDPEDPLARQLKAAQKRLFDAVEQNRRVNQAHQDAVQRMWRLIRDSGAQAEDDGTYTAKPDKQRPRGRHGLARNV